MDAAALVEVMMELDCMDSNGKVSMEEFIFKLNEISPRHSFESAEKWSSLQTDAGAGAASGWSARTAFEAMFPADVAARTRSRTDVDVDSAAPPNVVSAAATGCATTT